MTIVDNGPGIDPEFAPKIFDRFARADKARSGSDGTTGLGLAIVQAIVQAHGGLISVRSRPGRTEFFGTSSAYAAGGFGLIDRLVRRPSGEQRLFKQYALSAEICLSSHKIVALGAILHLV